MNSLFLNLWKMLTTNLGTKAISVVVAILLWAVVLISRHVELTKEVPLEILTPSELVVSNEIPEKIGFRLSGPKAFLRAVLDRKEEPIRVNLVGAKQGVVTYRFFSDNIRLPIGVKVLSVTPSAILIKLEPQKTKEVPIRLQLQGALPTGYQITQAEIVPPKVKIKGAETRIAEVLELVTLPVNVSTLTENFEKEIALDLLRLGVELEGPLPQVKINVAPATANFRIRNVEVRILSSHQVRLLKKTVTVLVRASEEDQSKLDRKTVYAFVDSRDKDKGEYEEPLKVMLPDRVGLIRVIPDKVKFTLY